MNIIELTDSLERCPVIPAIKDGGWASALSSPAEILFYLKANIITLPTKIKEAHENGKKIFVHIDLAEGIGKDRTGIRFAKCADVDGIISTRSNLIKTASEMGLLTVQRFFIIDSHSVLTTTDALKNSKTDMIEVMPGVVPKVIRDLKEQISLPIIAGGLIYDESDIKMAKNSGAAAVSTGATEFWR